MLAISTHPNMRWQQERGGGSLPHSEFSLLADCNHSEWLPAWSLLLLGSKSCPRISHIASNSVSAGWLWWWSGDPIYFS
jgi:hypothetical protein